MLEYSTIWPGTLCGASDDNPIKAARSGRTEAFGLLYERHKDAVYAFVVRSGARTEDAEDILQETFCRAWRALPQFRGDAKLKSWLYSIAANLRKEHWHGEDV